MRNRKSLQALPDQLLVDGFLSGDTECFDELYERYKRQIYGYLNKLLPGQNALVDDIFQQTWIKVTHQLGKYRNQQKFVAWVIRIAHNLAMDHFRKHKKHQNDLPIDEERLSSFSSKEKPWQNLEREELSEALEQALSQLPADQREVFLLRQDEISFKEIAKIQQTSINTTLARMQYALRNLQKKLSIWKRGR